MSGDALTVFPGFKPNKPTLRTRQSLSYIQATKPELFANRKPVPSLSSLQTQTSSSSTSPPLGFEDSERPGWKFNKEKQLYYECRTGRLCWCDAEANELRDLHHGEALPLSYACSATTQLAGLASNQPGPKTVIIPEVHRVEKFLGVDLNHLDKPAAMLGVFGTSDEVPVDVGARSLHEKVIKRLASFRGEWGTDALTTAVVKALSDIGASCGGSKPNAAFALIVGRHVCAVAAPGSQLCLIAVAADATPLPSARSAVEPDLTISTGELQEGTDTPESLYVVLSVGQHDCKDSEVAAIVLPYLIQGRTRAASVALLKSARACGVGNRPLAAACARLGRARPASDRDGRPLKKPRTTEEAPSKVRVRQILLRHWRGSGPKPQDPAHRKVVSRSPEEAETQLLGVLDKLAADSCASFSTICKQLSECQSALKGGENVGDVGWLSESSCIQNPKAAIQIAVPACVRKVALELEIGELSDLVSSEMGSHLLLRTA